MSTNGHCLKFAAEVILMKPNAVLANGDLLNASVGVRKHLPLELSKAIFKTRVKPVEHLPRTCHLQVVHVGREHQDDNPSAVHEHDSVQEVAVEQGNHRFAMLDEKLQECQLEHQRSIGETVHGLKAEKQSQMSD